MDTNYETVIVRTPMENRWKGLQNRGHETNKDLVFYKDMRFWLILVMLTAFFAFTLLRFP